MDRALGVFPSDGELLEQRAAGAAAQNRHDEAVRFLIAAWDAGQDPLSWLTRGRLEEHVQTAPYRDLLDADILLTDLADVDRVSRHRRLGLLAGHLDETNAVRLVDFLAGSTDAESLRLGLRALRPLESAGEHLVTLLDAAAPQVRRAALIEALHSGLGDLDALGRATADADPGNADLAAVIVANRRGEASAVAEDNRFGHLLDGMSQEKDARAQEVDDLDLDDLRTPIRPAVGDSLVGYWECMERSDLREIRALLHHHRTVETIDATVYGLPARDFDDQKNLTIPERLFLRAWARQHGETLATEGPMQYHREARHLLRKMLRTDGKVIDCAGFLVDAPVVAAEKLLQDDGGEVKVQEDSGVDNEVNVAVNPYDPRHVIVTSNDYGGGSGNDLYR
ncbi:MAG: hypothetical protein AAGE94_24525 [Acidobacteriota bacterium]